MNWLRSIIVAGRAVCEPCGWGRHLECTRIHCDCCGDYTRAGVDR